MGREVASALARWFVLENFPVRAELTAVCDLAEKQREWFRQVSTVKLITADYSELLASPDVDIVYVAVPHPFHEADLSGRVEGRKRSLCREAVRY